MTTHASELKPVLFVVTSNAVKGATGISTGFNLAEVTHPLEKLQAAGIGVECASIQGGAAPLDGLEDFNDPVIARYWADAEFRHAIAHTLRLDDVEPSRYSAIFFAGGHGTMWDFPDSVPTKKLYLTTSGNGDRLLEGAFSSVEERDAASICEGAGGR
jgi:putative intracellular protease/amidase